MSNNILVTPIQINGNLTKSLAQATPQLKERELYIAYNGYLYYGTGENGNSATVKVEHATKAETAEKALSIGNDTSAIQIKPGTTNIERIGHLMLTAYNPNINEYVWQGYANSKQTTLKEFKLNTVRFLSVDKALYGVGKPTGVAVEGQIYFRLPDEG